MFIYLGGCRLQFSGMEKRGCSKNSCEYISYVSSKIFIVWPYAQFFLPSSSSNGHIENLILLHCLSLPNLRQVLSENVVVRDSSGKEIESQILPITNASVVIRNYYVMAYLGKIPTVTPKYWLAFSAKVPPLGFSTYIISKANRKG